MLIIPQRFGGLVSIPRIAAVAPVDVTFLGSNLSETFSTTFTFTNCNFGTASDDRYIVVMATGMATNARTITDITIGGIPATLIPTGTTSKIAPQACGILNVPSGTSGTITVRLNTSTNRCRVGWWALRKLKNAGAATDFAGVGTTSSEPNPLTVSLDVEAGGVILAHAYVNIASATFSWTNVTQDDNIQSSNGSASWASALFPSAQTVNVRAQRSAGTSAPRLLAVSFR